MAKKAGNGSGNRSMGEAIVFILLTGVVILELHLVFKDWWPVWGVWVKKNPLAVMLLVVGLLMGPMAAMQRLKSIGKDLGQEAEEIGRGMQSK